MLISCSEHSPVQISGVLHSASLLLVQRFLFQDLIFLGVQFWRRKTDSGGDAPAFNLPRARKDPHHFCSLSIGENKPCGCLDAKRWGGAV